jgi:colanic acid biosynthesis glycosyl transferase WcaI
VKILLVGLNFAPELIGVGKYTGELAVWLAKQGHDVRVVTAPPYYPAWRIASGYRACCYERGREQGVQVLRCPIWVPSAPTTPRRILHLLSFALSSFVPTVWQGLTWRPDVVWTAEPTAFSAPSALLAARLGGALACLHVQDLEVEAAESLRMLTRSWLVRAWRGAYGWVVRRFDLVSTISAALEGQIGAFGVASSRQCLFPNWVDTQAIRPLPEASPLRAELGLPEGQVVALYAGNMGEKQSVESLVEVAIRLERDPDITVVLAGDGAVRAKVEAMTSRLTNVVMLPLQSSARLNDLLNLADIHLLPQRPSVGSFALPSKFVGMLASGRPVVVQAEGGELSQIAQKCGVLLEPGDPAAMAAAIRDLAADRERREALGRTARRYAEMHFSRAMILGRYAQELEERVEIRRHRQNLAARLLAALTPARPPEGSRR